MSKDKKIGMYNETPKIKIGEFSISRQNPDGVDDSIWIQRDDGEGVEIKETAVAVSIEKLFVQYI